MEFTRQEGILPNKMMNRVGVSMIGSGAIGSFSSLAIAKMGVRNIQVFDEDGVTGHNIPNQFFKHTDVEEYKVDALKNIISEFAPDTSVTATNNHYVKQELYKHVIVATDSMSSRRTVWERFKECKIAKHLIEARMGGEVGIVYAISKDDSMKLSEKDIKMYEDTLYSDEEAEELPCTEKAIIYNVLMLSSLVCRALKAKIMSQPFNRETIFSMNNMFFQTQA